MALAIFGLFFLVLEQSFRLHKEWDDRHEYEKRQAQEASEAIREHCSIADTPLSRVAHCLEKEINSYIEEKNTSQDLKAQKDMAYWAQVMAWVTVAGFFVSVSGLFLMLFVSLRQTRTAIKDTRELGEAQARAYLSLDISGNDFPIVGFKEENPNVETKVTNFGSSPSMRSRLASTLLYRNRGFQTDNADIIIPTARGPEPSIVVPSGSFFIGQTTSNKKITPQMWKEILRPDPDFLLVLVGIILYEDVFRKKHRTRFCLALHVKERKVDDDGLEKIRVTWRHTDLHNDAD